MRQAWNGPQALALLTHRFGQARDGFTTHRARPFGVSGLAVLRGAKIDVGARIGIFAVFGFFCSRLLRFCPLAMTFSFQAVCRRETSADACAASGSLEGG